MEGRRENGYLGSVDGVDESSKSGWYLFLLTISIGGYVLFCSVFLDMSFLALPA